MVQTGPPKPRPKLTAKDPPPVRLRTPSRAPLEATCPGRDASAAAALLAIGTGRPRLQGRVRVGRNLAAIAIVAPEPEDDRQSALLQYDLGQATYAMTVAAADLGVGTGHAAAADQDQARMILGFPQGHFLAYMLSVGYPSDKPLAVIERLNRRPFDEVVHRGRW